MATGDLFYSVRTFPQHPCNVSPLLCQIPQPTSRSTPLVYVSRCFVKHLSILSPFSFSFSRSSGGATLLLYCTPFSRPKKFVRRSANRRGRGKLNLTPRRTGWLAEWETVRGIFLPEPSRDIFFLVYLLRVSACLFLSYILFTFVGSFHRSTPSPVRSSRYAAGFREKY